jgi:hypothetical protein
LRLLFPVHHTAVAATKVAHGHFHVGLARAHPHLSNGHVVEGNGVRRLDRDDIGTHAGGRSLDLRPPFAGLVGVNGHRCIVPARADRDFLTRRGPSPDWRLGLLLEHHARAEDGGKLDVGLSRGTGEDRRGECNWFHVQSVPRGRDGAMNLGRTISALA